MDPPSTVSVFSMSNAPLMDALFDTQRFLQDVGRAESAVTSFEKESSISDGSHPVISMVHKVSDLAAAHRGRLYGSVYYASIIRFLYTVCQVFPSVYLSTVIGAFDYLDHPVATFHPPTDTPSRLLLLPLELLDHIFGHVPWNDLLRSCVTCRQWCQVATRFTHAHIVLRLSPDWQVAIVNAGGFTSLMDEYALTQYMAMTYFIGYWGIAPYVVSVSEGWDLRSVLWSSDNLPRSSLSVLSPPTMRHLTIDFSADDVHPINWLPDVNRPYDQLYMQMFKTKDLTDALALRRVRDGLFPVQLRLDNVTSMEIVVGRTMLPTQTDMWSVLTSLVTLKVVMCRKNPQYLSEVNICHRFFSLTYPLRQATYTPISDFPLLTFDFYLNIVSLTLCTLANIHRSCSVLGLKTHFEPLSVLKHLTSELDSTLDLVFMFDKFARGTLPNFLVRQAMLPVLDGASTGSTMETCISGTDKLYARSVASYVEVDTAVLLNGEVDV
ncbi:hypothetical protein F5146DRAFT_1218442 [Armillaria mellea]|nr:hypothetical protein F5146DRAFT_1218442 [Armillaria mellea]